MLGHPPVELAMELMRKRGIDITRHQARHVNTMMINRADLVVVTEEKCRGRIQRRVPSCGGKVFRQGHFSDIDIPDAYRLPEQRFVEALEMIELGVSKWAYEINRTESALS